jgi:hypothetical protein
MPAKPKTRIVASEILEAAASSSRFFADRRRSAKPQIGVTRGEGGSESGIRMVIRGGGLNLISFTEWQKISFLGLFLCSASARLRAVGLSTRLPVLVQPESPRGLFTRLSTWRATSLAPFYLARNVQTGPDLFSVRVVFLRSFEEISGGDEALCRQFELQCD